MGKQTMTQFRQISKIKKNSKSPESSDNLLKVASQEYTRIIIIIIIIVIFSFSAFIFIM